MKLISVWKDPLRVTIQSFISSISFLPKNMHVYMLVVEGIDTKFEGMDVKPQTPKCYHNRGVASVVVTFGSLWCHSHDRKRGINFYSIMVPQN